jgi:hypothetical protein
MNTADLIAHRFHNDGQIDTDDQGINISTACHEYNPHIVSDDEWGVKYVFHDESAIAISAESGAWDLALSPMDDGCFCWAGLGKHCDDCPRSKTN